ncbi:hypothetical protein [Megalodesulfovibrio gigas]|uniref:Putative ATPases with chaperone activity, ATP-binding subunit n=1 Tax=Megalodesulfovibrio gigas (strain ATCC 19364 / DSM 1382 / NCIMB 9332 / VKM B-1759) TaxID=1121448 RepID=T2GCA3_MEGG1|nr:hypothetical protein [Megalodesulfovibrio gigas]AGW14200.1 putative ATPases with chaperone activity, ATP-binding subunit [Megalodesulfovibrio gigas DSM 1382 = ATCC 19364]
MTTSSKKIIIDLSKSREATSALGPEDLIQQEAFTRFRDLLTDIHKRIKPFTAHLDMPESWLWPERPHDVITVDGSRGSGKTTFILNACRILTGKDRSKEKPFDKIAFLGIIDPTLVETREHVFISILSSIKRRVDERVKEKNSSCHERDKKYEAWNESLQHLACGITILDGVGQDPLSNGDWMDEHYVLEHGIKNASSGKALERNFHLFVKESLEFLGQDAFLLVFDDIDTDFSKGWTVLEIIRKYLTTPQLMVVLSGDLKLYSLLVEKQQWERLGKRLPWNEEQDEDSRLWPVVRELQDQYLLKILKPAHRIELRELEHYSQTPYELLVRRDNDDPEASLREVLEAFCRRALHCNATGERTRLANMLLQRPVRTVIALLNAYAQLFPKKKDQKEEKEKDQERVENESAALGDYQKRMLDLYLALAHVFHTSLNRMGYSVAELERFDPCRSVETLISKLLGDGIFRSTASMRPIYTADYRNDAMLCLGGVFAWHMAQQPAGYFHYLFKVCLTAELLKQYQLIERRTSYTRHTGLLRNETPLHIGRSYLSFRYRTSITKVERPALEQGSLRLRAQGNENLSVLRDRLYEETSADGGGSAVSPLLKSYWERIKVDEAPQGTIRGLYFNSMDSLAKGITSWHAHIAQLPYSINLINGKSNPHFSFFSLFGALGVLLEGTSLEATLPVASQARMFPVWIPESDDETPSLDDEAAFPEVLETQGEGASDVAPAFRTAWAQWTSQTPLDFGGVPSTTVLARAWTRFHYSLVEMSEQLERFDCLAGKVMHRWIIAFLHAVLLEEALERHGPVLPDGDKLVLDNAITSDKPFRNLLRKLKLYQPLRVEEHRVSDMGPLPLFSWFYSCPLWSLFLKPTLPEDKPSAWRHQMEFMERHNILGGVEATPEAFRQALQVPYQYATSPYPNLYPLLNSLGVVGMEWTVKRVFHETVEDSITFGDGTQPWEVAIRHYAKDLKAIWAEKAAARGPRQTDEAIALATLRKLKRNFRRDFPNLEMDGFNLSDKFYTTTVFPLFRKYVLNQ